MPFIESAGTQQGLPPFSFPGLSITSFVLPADIVRLQGYCDLCLNIDPQHHFRPLGSNVCLSINQYPRMDSEYPGRSELGYTSQNEYYFMFPAVRYVRVRGNFLLPREITWVFPFIGVDNSTSAFIGREMLGFQKLLGAISAETAADGRFLASVAMPAFKSFSRNTPEAELPLIGIRTGPPLSLTGTQAHSFPWNLVGVAAEAELLDDLALALFDLIDPGGFSVTNLKQVRDGPNPEEAAYQALVRCEWQQTNSTAPTVYDGAEIDVFDNATIQIVETLGLSQGKGARLEPLEATGLTTDMTFGAVTNLFVAS
jgi:hypothetical protein